MSSEGRAGLRSGDGMTQTEVLLNAREVAELLGVEQSWVRRATQRGEIPYLRLGRYLRFRQESIREWVEDMEQQSRDSSENMAGLSRRGAARARAVRHAERGARERDK